MPNKSDSKHLTDNKEPSQSDYVLSNEQLNFLTMLKKCGTEPFDTFGDRIGNIEAEKQLKEMHVEGFLTYTGVDATITELGLQQVKDRETYFY
ncbi:MAG: hypothetical protein ACREVX_16060 [Clostridium sp.]|uniref:hypothetical protein n=1 Tax=Clostridium sp. TaxID=1506 RepID=UPI003D6DA682